MKYTACFTRIGAMLLSLGFLCGGMVSGFAQAPQMLYTTNGAAFTWRNNFSQTIGGRFQMGASDIVITHVGFVDKDGDGLTSDHPVCVFSYPSGLLLASNTVPSGTGALFTNAYRWVQLATPLTLKAGSNYVIASYSPSGGDAWPDLFYANWNSNNFVGNVASSTRFGRYGGSLPTMPPNDNGQDRIYGAPNIAYFPGGVLIGQHPQSVTLYTNETALISITAAGATGYQWYKSPSTLLSGQNSATLTLNNLTLGDAGSYYCVASNATSSATSSNAVLTVLPWSAPAFQIQPQSVTAYIYQQLTLTSLATGSPSSSITYQWKKGATVLAGQTNASLTFSSLNATNAGTYTVVASNSISATTSSSAVLTVITPTPGTYEATIVAAQPALYYRFSDIDSSSNVMNLGTLGAPVNGLVEGTNGVDYSGADGPLPPSYSNFESTNRSIYLYGTGTAGDVRIPPMNLNTSGGPTVTMAAWVNPSASQQNYAGILVSRIGGQEFGLSVVQDAFGQNKLIYAWNNLYYTFDSGLIMTNNQWSLVTLVVQSNQATLYLNSGYGLKSAVNVNPHVPCAFGSATYVGYDESNPVRRWNGLIDEAVIFNRALTANEVNALYGASGNNPPTILSDPQPVNQYINVPFALTVGADGAPTLRYQWWKQGSGPIAGATNLTYSVASASFGDSGNYYVVVTNSLGSVTSAVATVTILDPELSDQMLYATNGYTILRNDFTNNLGCTFRVGPNNVRITHLGYFDATGTGLQADHYVGIFTRTTPPTNGIPLATVLVPAGTGALYTNGFRWVALNNPLTLVANTDYVIASSNNVADSWPERYVPAWNSAVVGANAGTTRFVMYDDVEPQAPFRAPQNDAGSWGYNQTYGPFNLASFVSTNAPTIANAPQSVTNYIAVPFTLSVTADGAPKLRYQWWKQGSGAIAGATNSSYTVTLPVLGDAGNYYVVVTNSAGSVTSPLASVVILDPTLSDQMLYATNGYTTLRNDYAPNLGCTFRVGARNVTVTHLGYFDATGFGLLTAHDVGIFSRTTPSTNGTALATVVVPAGTGASYKNGYRWVKLTTPFTLQANTDYVIASSTNNADLYPDSFTPAWNTAVVGANAGTTRIIMYDDPAPFRAPANDGVPWGYNHTYGAFNLASFVNTGPVTITNSVSGGNLILSWPSGTLQQSTNVAGPYNDVIPSSSPYAAPMTNAAMFFRIRQ